MVQSLFKWISWWEWDLSVYWFLPVCVFANFLRVHHAHLWLQVFPGSKHFSSFLAWSVQLSPPYVQNVFMTIRSHGNLRNWAILYTLFGLEAILNYIWSHGSLPHQGLSHIRGMVRWEPLLTDQPPILLEAFQPPGRSIRTEGSYPSPPLSPCRGRDLLLPI